MTQFNSNFSDEIDQDASTTATYLCTILQFLLTKQMIAPLLTTVRDHTDGCAKQYRCSSTIYLISCLVLEFNIIIDRAVVSPGNGKNVVDGLSARDKRMLTLEMEKLVNPGLI